MNDVASSPPAVGISFADLLRVHESEAAKSRAWLERQPAMK
jgi:hypothetical protein